MVTISGLLIVDVYNCFVSDKIRTFGDFHDFNVLKVSRDAKGREAFGEADEYLLFLSSDHRFEVFNVVTRFKGFGAEGQRKLKLEVQLVANYEYKMQFYCLCGTIQCFSHDLVLGEKSLHLAQARDPKEKEIGRLWAVVGNGNSNDINFHCINFES